MIERINELAKVLEMFIYDPDSNITFDVWLKKCEDVFNVEASDLGETSKMKQITVVFGVSVRFCENMGLTTQV